MFGLNGSSGKKQDVALCFGEKYYSIAGVGQDNSLLFAESRVFSEDLSQVISQGLTNDVERLNLIGASCQVVLTPDQYQLVLMDALNVPPEEMAKAIRWKLKGLIDYPLNDIAVDVYPIPPYGVAGRQKKVLVAVTPMSKLKNKLSLFESAYLRVAGVGISELALRNILALVSKDSPSPIIVISLENGMHKLQIFFENYLYLVRALNMPSNVMEDGASGVDNVLLEIQRSMDYCLSELKLSEVKKIYFTPGYHQANTLLSYLNTELAQEVELLDLAKIIEVEPGMNWKKQHDCFYSIGGALNHIHVQKQKEQRL